MSAEAFFIALLAVYAFLLFRVAQDFRLGAARLGKYQVARVEAPSSFWSIMAVKLAFLLLATAVVFIFASTSFLTEAPAGG